MKKVLFSSLIYSFIWLVLTDFRYDFVNLIYLSISTTISLFATIAIARDKDSSERFNLYGLLYFFWLLKEIFLSTISVIKIIWSKNLIIKPVVCKIGSLQTTELGIVTYANSITLTPGTVTLMMNDKMLLVHSLDQQFMDGLHEGVMDKKLLQICSSD